MSDGALRSDILAGLREKDVEVTSLPENRFRLTKGDVFETIRLGEIVSRGVAEHLGRTFGVSKSRFFPPLKVVPIDRPKASGETNS